MVNKTAYDSLPKDLQQIIEKASRAVNQDMLDEYTARNNSALKELVDVHGVKVERLPQSVIDYLKLTSDEMYSELAAEDENFARVYKHYREFAEGAKNYHKISEQSYYEARVLK